MRGSFASASWVLALLAASAPSLAAAAEGTELASAMDDDDPFDLFVGFDFSYAAKRAAIKREYAGLMGSEPDGPTPIAKDLLYIQDRLTITPRLQLGLYHDLELSIALPIVIRDSRRLDFDQRDTPCDFDGTDATCINETNSSTFRDGLLPASAGQIGYDASDPTTNFAPGSKTVFRGVDRSGLDQIFLGLAWAPTSQRRDDTKPDWTLGVELRLDIGEPMRFDRLNPTLEESVGHGYDEIRLYTAMSKRLPWAEPFVQFWWQAPLFFDAAAAPEAGQKPSSQFWDVGFGQDSVDPQQMAGTVFGLNGIAFEDKRNNQYLAIEVRGHAEAHFQGRGYSEMWEVFALGGDVTTNPDAPLAIDRDPTMAGDAPIAHPGVTTIENYLSFGGRIGVRAQVGDHAKFNAGFQLDYDQPHRISWTDAGKELPRCEGAETSSCEVNNDTVVTPGTKEVNPLFVRGIDLPGRRFLVDESLTYALIVSGTIMF